MSELAADGIPVAVTCRILKIARQPYYRWLTNPVTTAELVEAYRANALFDAHQGDPEYGHRFLTNEARDAGQSMAIEVERSIPGDHLVCILDWLTAVHGYPQFVRMVNDPDKTCHAIADWCRFSLTGSVVIEPGSPCQNTFVESAGGKLRDELLANEKFHRPLESKVMAEDYRQHYNTYRPQSSPGYLTPDGFAL